MTLVGTERSARSLRLTRIVMLGLASANLADRFDCSIVSVVGPWAQKAHHPELMRRQNRLQKQRMRDAEPIFGSSILFQLSETRNLELSATEAIEWLLTDFDKSLKCIGIRQSNFRLRYVKCRASFTRSNYSVCAAQPVRMLSLVLYRFHKISWTGSSAMEQTAEWYCSPALEYVIAADKLQSVLQSFMRGLFSGRLSCTPVTGQLCVRKSTDWHIPTSHERKKSKPKKPLGLALIGGWL